MHVLQGFIQPGVCRQGRLHDAAPAHRHHIRHQQHQFHCGHIQNQYRSALEAIKKEWPYADIIINAVPPVAQTRTGAAAAQKAIDEFNKALADLAKEDGYRFLNSSEALKDPATGFARASYMIEDGLHLNEQGAKALIDYVRTHTYETEDRRPALTTIPTHTATPEETFNPQAASSSSSSSSSEAEGVTVTFSIKDGKDGGSLSGTLTQKVKPGETCSTVTATAKEGYSLEWGCTEGRIENVNNGTLTFTVPANTKLESISVWVTFKISTRTVSAAGRTRATARIHAPARPAAAPTRPRPRRRTISKATGRQTPATPPRSISTAPNAARFWKAVLWSIHIRRIPAPRPRPPVLQRV